jgi:hypothetical protein
MLILDCLAMRPIYAKPPVFIGDIDLGNRTILRIDILPSERKVRYAILRRDGEKLAIFGRLCDRRFPPSALQMLTVNANARAKIEFDEL